MHLEKNKFCACIALGLMLYFLFLGSCSSQPEDRNTISFKDSVILVTDSIKLMTFYLDRIKDADGKNFFFDNQDSLYINNSRVARMAIGDKIDFLSDVQEITGLSETDSYRFISLALYLKNNHISGCFKHHYFGVYFYNYRRTRENDNDDQRYILLFDKEIQNLKGSEIESYHLIDRKGELLLVAPSDAKIKIILKRLSKDFRMWKFRGC